MSEFEAPRRIRESDDSHYFDCGEPTLNAWLRDRALRNERDGHSRTFVSIERGTAAIAGYYCLSASGLVRDEAPNAVRRQAPDPIPVILIGRLAVGGAYKGQGLGFSLLQHALMNGLRASEIVGARAFVVHAISADAVSFYKRFGFDLMPHSEQAMYLLIQDVEQTALS